MRTTRAIALIAAPLSLSLALAAPASAAAAPGTWRAFGNTNPVEASSATWRCASSREIADNMIAQVCAISGADGESRQGAVIVRNNRSSVASASAAVNLYGVWSGEDPIGQWTCGSSGVAAHSWSVCFGATIDYSSKVWANGDAKGVGLGFTGDI
jgi:hypothetical protein